MNTNDQTHTHTHTHQHKAHTGPTLGPYKAHTRSRHAEAKSDGPVKRHRTALRSKAQNKFASHKQSKGKTKRSFAFASCSFGSAFDEVGQTS